MENRTLIFDHPRIENLFQKAATLLLDPEQAIPVQYKDFQSESFDACNTALLTAVSRKNIVYCLWAGSAIEELDVVYIGHVERNQSRQRVRNHLCKNHERTGAQLKKVKAILEQQGALAFSFVEIEPDYMRKALEDWLIDNYRKQLIWNIAGKRE